MRNYGRLSGFVLLASLTACGGPGSAAPHGNPDNSFDSGTPGQPGGDGDGDGDAGGAHDMDASTDGGSDQPTRSVEILAKFGDVVVGGKTPLRALVREADKILGGQPLSWSSDTPAVAAVDADTGIVTGVAKGSAMISVASNGATTSVKVNVEAAVAEPALAFGVSLPEFVCVLSRAGRIYCVDQDGTHIGGADSDLSWRLIPSTVRFKKLVGSDGMMFALGLDGQLYSFGNGSALLGQDAMDTRSVHTPTPVASATHFKEVAVAGGNAAALAEDGSLYEWGIFQSGAVYAPTATAVDAKFDQISVSRSHLLAHGTDGETYSWSRYAGSGQLYLGVPKAGGEHPGVLPTAIATPVPFVSVEAGVYVSFGLNVDGTGYSWGARNPDYTADDLRGMSMHGRGDTATPTDQPTLLATTEHFVSIVAGTMQVTALDAEGVPFVWGQDALLKHNASGGAYFDTGYVPTKMDDTQLLTVVSTAGPENHGALSDGWLAYDADGHGSAWGISAVQVFEQYLFGTDDNTTSELTVSQGSSAEIAQLPFTEARNMTANGFAFPSDEIPLTLNTNDVEPAPGKLEVEGITYELKPPTIKQGQAATNLVITPGPSAAFGTHTVYVGGGGGYGTIKTLILPPDPPPGTPYNLVCPTADTQLPLGYWCLTNSGNATAPHNWKILKSQLPNSTWQYGNLCISYFNNGTYQARFKNPDDSISTIYDPAKTRYGVLARHTGDPEVTDTGDWLLYHQGIGDPQVEQLTFNPNTGAVGAAWPFTKQTCTF